MKGLNIEGDCAQINEKQLEFIKNVIEKNGFKNNKVIIEPVGNAGDNYMANVKRIIVEDGNGGSFKMVVKISPQNKIQRKYGFTESMFRNEHLLYTKILPKYTQLEEKYDVLPQDRLRYPICYGSSDEAPNEVLLLEDLNESNFKMLSRFEPLNNDCVKSIIRNIALLHSLGFALKYKEPDVFQEYKNSLFDMNSNMDDDENSAAFFKSMESKVVSILESDYYKNKVHEALTNSFFNSVKKNQSDIDSKYSIIQHGDAWTNNFMFEFDGDTVNQSILIDYQMSKAANPMADLLFMISTCTDYEARKEHFLNWIDYYHSELEKALSNYGLKSNFVYSKEQLDVDLKRYGIITFGQTVFMLGLIVLKPEEGGKVKEAFQEADNMEAIANQIGAANSNDLDTIANFKNKIEALVDSYHEYGLL